MAEASRKNDVVPGGFNRILDLFGLPNQAHPDSFMQILCCWAHRYCFVTLDPRPLWLSRSFFRFNSVLCFEEGENGGGTERVPGSCLTVVLQHGL